MAKKPKNQGISRRNLLIGGGTALLGGLWYLAAKDPALPQTLKEQHPDAASRQAVILQSIRDPRIAPVYANVEAITYAPRLEALCAYLQQKIPTLPQELRAGVQKKLDHYRTLSDTLEKIAKGADPESLNDQLAVTDPTGTGTSRVFLTERVFESPYVRTREDLGSVLYHEGLHAVINRNGPTFVPKTYAALIKKTGSRTVPQELLHHPDFLRALVEVQVYNKQIFENLQGTFKVSPEFSRMLSIAYYPHYAALKDYARQDNVVGWYAQAMLETVVVHPKVNRK